MSKRRFQALRKFNRSVLNPIIKQLIRMRIINHPIIYHIGRRTGKEYATPALAKKVGEHIYVPLTYGIDSDWNQNILATGNCRVLINRKEYMAQNPKNIDAQGAAIAFPKNADASIRVNQFLRLTIKNET